MNGEGICKKAPDYNLEGLSHCIHQRVRAGDFVCCWCGDLFVDDEEKADDAWHGRYKPKRRARGR